MFKVKLTFAALTGELVLCSEHNSFQIKQNIVLVCVNLRLNPSLLKFFDLDEVWVWWMGLQQKILWHTGEARWLLGERAQAANIYVLPSIQVDGKLSENTLQLTI